MHRKLIVRKRLLLSIMLFVLFYVNRATRERKEELKKMYVANFLHSLDSAHVSYSPIISDVK
jgi:hypothetical protein